jgi:hypothetical protein
VTRVFAGKVVVVTDASQAIALIDQIARKAVNEGK